MPTKYTGTKDSESEEKTRMKKHKLLRSNAKQIDRYIDKKVTDLESAKEVLKLIAKVALLKP